MESESDDSSLEHEREELFHLVWSMPSERVAAKLGISGAALSKRCKKLGIPKPPRGYWARFKGNPDRPIPPMTAFQDMLAARLHQKKSIQPGLHLSERKQELFKKAAATVLTQNPQLKRFEFKGSRAYRCRAIAGLRSPNHGGEALRRVPAQHTIRFRQTGSCWSNRRPSAPSPDFS